VRTYSLLRVWLVRIRLSTGHCCLNRHDLVPRLCRALETTRFNGISQSPGTIHQKPITRSQPPDVNHQNPINTSQSSEATYQQSVTGLERTTVDDKVAIVTQNPILSRHRRDGLADPENPTCELRQMGIQPNINHFCLMIVLFL
jgi:hypothetical protein